MTHIRVPDWLKESIAVIGAAVFVASLAVLAMMVQP